MPLSARIVEQSLLLVVADDEDLHAASEHREYGGAPMRILQVLKDPRRTGVHVADVIGLLGADTDLPLDALDAERAADRLPPRLVASRLIEAAGSPADDGSWGTLASWVDSHLAWATLGAPLPADRRPGWLADLPPAPLPEPPAAAEPTDGAEPAAAAEPDDAPA